MRIAVNGVDLFFDVYGSSLAVRGNELVDKPVIVALHGGPGIDHSQFVPWLTPIADQAQLILVDHRGNGRCVPSLVVWRCTGSYDGAWRRSSRCNGHRSRSPAG